jgi:hypothetical protein
MTTFHKDRSKLEEARDVVGGPRNTAPFLIAKILAKIRDALLSPSSDLESLLRELQKWPDKKLFDLWMHATPNSETRQCIESIAFRKHEEDTSSFLYKFIEHTTFQSDPIHWLKKADGGSVSESELIDKLEQLDDNQLFELWKELSIGSRIRSMIEIIAISHSTVNPFSCLQKNIQNRKSWE